MTEIAGILSAFKALVIVYILCFVVGAIILLKLKSR